MPDSQAMSDPRPTAAIRQRKLNDLLRLYLSLRIDDAAPSRGWLPRLPIFQRDRKIVFSEQEILKLGWE